MDHEHHAAREAFFAAAPNIMENECLVKVEVITKGDIIRNVLIVCKFSEN